MVLLANRSSLQHRVTLVTNQTFLGKQFGYVGWRCAAEVSNETCDYYKLYSKVYTRDGQTFSTEGRIEDFIANEGRMLVLHILHL